MPRTFFIILVVSLVLSSAGTLGVDLWLHRAAEERRDTFADMLPGLVQQIGESDDPEAHAHASFVFDWLQNSTQEESVATHHGLWSSLFLWLFGYTLLAVAGGCFWVSNRRRRVDPMPTLR